MLQETISFVFESYTEVHAHRFGRFHSFTSIIMSVDFAIIGVVLIVSLFPAHRLRRLWGLRRGRRFILLCALLSLRRPARRVTGHSSQERRWSGLFIFVGTGHVLVIKLGLVSDGNLCMLFVQIGGSYFEWRILDKVRREVLDEVLRIGKIVDIHMYKLNDGASSDDSMHGHFNSLIEKCYRPWEIHYWRF